MCLQFGFLIFWRKDFGAKAAHKMVVKLTPGVFGETGKVRDAKLRRERRDVPVPGTGDAPVVAGLSEVVGRIGVYPEGEVSLNFAAGKFVTGGNPKQKNNPVACTINM